MMGFPSLKFIANALDSDGNIDFQRDLDHFDFDNDGEITAEDCPFDYGSAEAKLWWNNILEPFAKQSITDEMSSKYGDKVVGAYKGKALVPGEAGTGQGDFQFLVDKIRITQGLDYASAQKIAGKVKAMMY